MTKIRFFIISLFVLVFFTVFTSELVGAQTCSGIGSNSFTTYRCLDLDPVDGSSEESCVPNSQSESVACNFNPFGLCAFCGHVGESCNDSGSGCVITQNPNGAGGCGGTTMIMDNGCYTIWPTSAPGPTAGPGTPLPSVIPTSLPPQRWYDQRIAPAALVFLDINENGLFDPSPSNAEKFIYTPGNFTHYTWMGGGADFYCGTSGTPAANYNTGLGNINISFFGTDSSGDTSGNLSPLCYIQDEASGTNCNFSGGCCNCTAGWCGCNSGQDPAWWSQSYYKIDTNAYCSRAEGDFGSGCDFNNLRGDISVGGPLFYGPFPWSSSPVGYPTLHSILDRTAGQVWLNNTQGRKNMRVTIENLPTGYYITSTKYIQRLSSGYSLVPVCSTSGACSSTVNFTPAPNEQILEKHPSFAVAIYGINSCTKPVAPTVVTASDTVGEITVSWTNMVGNTGYKLYRIGSGGTWDPIPASMGTLGTNVNSLIDNVGCGSLYQYGVSTLDTTKPLSCQESAITKSNFTSCAVYNSWFGAEGGDIIAAAGNIGVSMPPGAPTNLNPSTLPDAYLINPAAGSSVPGIAFGVKGVDWGGSPALNSNTVSVRSWLADLKNAITGQVNKAENSYAAISERLSVRVEAPFNVATNIISNESEWNTLVNNAPDSSKFELSDGSVVVVLKKSGNLQFIGPIDVSNAGASNKKTIWLVDGNFGMGTSGGAAVNNKGVYMGDDTNGFLAVIASGSVTIGPAIGDSTSVEDLNIRLDTYDPHVEGIYYAGTTFGTSVSTRALKLEGSAIGMTGVTLSRTSAGPHPVEYFKFRPDLTMTLNQLGLRRKVQMDLQVP